MPRKVHPAANIFPMLEGDEYERLKSDIEKNGLKEPVVIYRKQLIDGRNRMRACEELGIDPLESELDDDQDPIAFVLSANLHRRQLKGTQRAMCAARVATLPRGNPNGKSLNLGITYTAEQASEIFGVSVAAIEHARKVIRDGCKELIALCESGRSVAKACKFIDECEGKKEQSAIAKDGWEAVSEHVPKPVKRAGNVKPTTIGNLPEKAPEEVVAEVEAWLETQDERPFFERFKTLWNVADDMGKAAIRAFILDN
jgi:hypothetical protein